MTRSLLLSLSALLLALPAAAESLVPREPAPAATIEIDPTRLSPAQMRLAEGHTVRISNHSTGLARVEFRIARGTVLPCGRPDGQPVAARKYVLAEGDSLVCSPPRGRVAYRVQRMVRGPGGGLRNEISDGEIEVR